MVIKLSTWSMEGSFCCPAWSWTLAWTRRWRVCATRTLSSLEPGVRSIHQVIKVWLRGIEAREGNVTYSIAVGAHNAPSCSLWS